MNNGDQRTVMSGVLIQIGNGVHHLDVLSPFDSPFEFYCRRTWVHFRRSQLNKIQVLSADAKNR